MTHKNKCEEKARYREEKQRHREEKRKEKQRHREEKRELKKRHREEKRKHREQFVEKLINMSLESSPNVVVGHSSSSNVRYINNEIPSERDEHDVATLRTIFPDCDPAFIRNYLANETKDDRVRKVAEKLLTTSYPKVAPVTPSTPPTAPPLLGRSSFESPLEEEAPPSYEETVGNQSLQPPPLPNRHQRSSSWNGTSSPSSRSTQSKNCPYSQLSRSASNASVEVADAIGTAVKSIISNFKPSTVERACHKYSFVWSRPVPSHVSFNPLSQQSVKILPKDKYSIQKGFNQSNFPSKELRYRDISEEDWYLFMNGLNSVIGVNSIKGNPNNFGEGFSVSLKWVSWMGVAMDDSLMESNVKAINEYVAKWNNAFFNPRQIMIQFIDNRDNRTAQSNNPFRKHQYEQYLLLKSI